MSRYMNLTVIEVRGPDRILARETPGPTASAETVEYALLFKEMNDYFNNGILTFEIHSPKPNEICVAQNSQNNRWHRVRVEEILMTLSGPKANCFFLDTGEKQLIRVVKIQKIPPRFLTVPFQVKVFALYGLQPLSLVVDPMLTAFQMPCKKWDTSAAVHIKTLINCASSIQAVIKSRGGESELLAMIYLRFSSNDEILSLNEELIDKGYAIKDPVINKSFGEETKNFVQNVFQTNGSLSPKVEQHEHPITKFDSLQSLNGFYRRSNANNSPAPVCVSSRSDIPEKNCSDDFGNLSPISSGSSRNSSFVHPSEQNSFSNSEECQKIPWSSLSQNSPPKTSVDQPMMTDAGALNQLLSYHKKLQQNDPIIKESGSLKASVSYQMPNLESENTLTAAESPSCNHDMPVSSIESDSSSTTEEESEMSYDSEEIENNAISPSVISTNINSKIISKLSPVKSSSQDVNSNSTTGNLTNFLAYHKKLINSNPETVPTESTSKTLGRSSSISATKIQLTTEADKINQPPNNFPVSNSVQIQAQHKRPNTRAHARQSVSKIGSRKSPLPVISQSSFIHRHSFTDSNYLDKNRCFEKTKPSLPFHRTQPKHGDMSLHCNQVKQFPLVPVFSESTSTNTRNMEKQTSMPFNKIQPKYDGSITNISSHYDPVKKSPHTPVLFESVSANSKNMEKQPNLLLNRIQPEHNYDGSISNISSRCDPVKTSPHTPVLFESVSTNSKNSVEKQANMLFNKIQPEDDDEDGSIRNIGPHCDPVKKSPHTPMFLKSASTNSKNSLEKEPNVLFSRSQSEDDDDRPISALSLYCNQLKKSQNVPAFLESDSTDSENGKPKFFQSSENLSSTNNCVISNEADIAANKILCIREEEIANRLNPNSARLIRDGRHNEKGIPSESEKCTNFQSNSKEATSPFSKEATSPFSHSSLTTSAVTMLNFSVSSKLLSSSSASTIRMLQGLNTLPLDKLNSCENGNPSGSKISKKFQTFTNIDDSDLSEIELDNASNFQTENNTREIIKNQRNVISSDNSKLLVQSQKFSNSECLSGFCDLSTVLSSNSKEVAHNFDFQSEIQGIQQDGTSRKADSVFDKMENHSLHKIENLPEIVTAIPNLEQDFTPIADIESTPNEIERLQNENEEKAGKAESFELLINENQNAMPSCISTNIADKIPTMVPDSTNCCKNTPTNVEVCEEKMQVNILPPLDISENDIFSVKTVPTNGSYQIISQEVGAFKTNENDKYNPFLKYFEQSHENDFFSSINFVSNSDFDVQSISTNLSSNEKETSCTSLSYAVQSTVASSAAVPMIDRSYAADDKAMALENKETPPLTAVPDAIYCRKIAPGFDLSSEVKAKLGLPRISREVNNTEISPSTNLLFETDDTEIEPSTVMSSTVSNSEIDLSSKVDNNEIIPAFGLSSKMEISPCIGVAFEKDNPEMLEYAGVSFEVDKTEILEPTVVSPKVNKTKILNPVHISSEMNNTKILGSTCFSSEVDNTEVLGSIGITSKVDNIEILRDIGVSPEIGDTKISEPIVKSKVDNTEILGFTSISSEVDNTDILGSTGVSEVDNIEALRYTGVSFEVDNTKVLEPTSVSSEVDNTEVLGSTGVSSEVDNTEVLGSTGVSSEVDNTEVLGSTGVSSEVDNTEVLGSTGVSSEVDNTEVLGSTGVSSEVDNTEVLGSTGVSSEVDNTKVLGSTGVSSEVDITELLPALSLSSEVDNTELVLTGLFLEVDNIKTELTDLSYQIANTEILGSTSASSNVDIPEVLEPTNISSEVDNTEILEPTNVSTEVDNTEILALTNISSEVENTEILETTNVSSEVDNTEILETTNVSSEVDNTEILALTNISSKVDNTKILEPTNISTEVDNTEKLEPTNVSSEVDNTEKLEPTNVSSEVDNTEKLEPTNVSSEVDNTEIALIDLSSEPDNTKIAFINMSSKVDNIQISPSTGLSSEMDNTKIASIGVSCSDDNAGTSPSSSNEFSAYSIVSTVDCDGSVECDVDNQEYTYDNVTSSSVLSFIKHKEIPANMSEYVENIPALYKNNTKSPSLIKELVPLNESMDLLSKTDNENILQVEDKIKPIRDERFLAMPALESVTDDSNSGFLSSSENEDALPESSSVGCPDDAQESADNKIDSASLAQPVPKANNKMPLSSINDETEEFDSVTSDQNCNTILCFPFSSPNDSQPVLPSVNDISGVMFPELSKSVSLSDSVHNELDDTIPVKQCAGIDLCENNDLHLDATHTVSSKERQLISASATDENNLVVSPLSNLSHLPQQEEMKHSTNPAVSISPTPVSLEQMIKSKDQSSNSAGKSLNARDHTMDCIRGRRILEKLGVTKKANITQKNPEQLTTESILLTDSVLFVAETIPNPIYSLQEFGVPEALLQLTENLNINPTPIQAYSWGPALRGKNIIGISPLGSGKTWAYLVPILASLCQYNIYSDIKFSNGPFVLILVSTWTKAISVYKQCKHLSQSNREIMIEIVYGGGEESKKSVNLLNGCHVLVATLPCFKRMFDSKFTSLDRLCHLVIDDADILLQDFYKEIVDLMCKYKNLVESRDKGYQRHQVMAYSSKWTSYIKGFVKNAVCDPVIIITDMMEAAIYGGIKQIPIMCEESDRNDQLVKLFPQILKKGEKVIVFSLDADCVELQNLLIQQLQIPVAVACNSLYKSELEIVAAEWKLPLSENEPYRVLVSSDTALCDLFINDATCVVHYRMPKKKIHIGLRIQTMSNYYQHYKNNQSPVKIVKSYILIIPENKKQVKSLRSFLMRSINVTDKETWDFLSNIRQDEDLNPKIKLCLNLKAFGKCRNKYQCNDRHSVVPSVDLNGTSSQHICLPTQGDVRVKILHVKTANNFYVRILEHKNGLHKSIQNHSDLATLIMEMAFYYNNHSNRLVLDELKAGTLCVVNTSEQFSRVKVVQPYDNAAKNTASLFFVDIGKLESHPICNLYQLADEFKIIPFQAVEVFLCHLRPVDFDTEWTPASNSFAESWLESKILYGKIRFVMDNTMWLDPLLKRTFLKAIKTVTNGPSLRRELISNNLAVDNPQHLIQLHQLFEGYVPKLIPLNNRQSSCSSWEFLLENETLQTPADDYENVVISYIFNPEHFYVQKMDMKICFNDLMNKIEEKMKVETEPQQKRDWCVGMHCLSKSLLDSRWYRVIILTLTDFNAVVHFVDYGNIEEVPIDELRTIPRELMYLPSQAIECKLAHIKPFEDQWSAKSSDMMYYMTQTVDNVYKTLALHVVSEIPTDGKLPQYCVTLLDTSYERVMNIGQELVWWKMAAPNDDHFQTLFPEEATQQMFYPSACKIADMCAILYTEQTSQQYDQLMTSYLKVCLKYPEKLLEENVPGCLLKLFSYTHNTEMFSSVLEYIKLLLAKPSLYGNLLSCGILQNLGQILKMHDDEKVLHKTFQLIQFMIRIDSTLIKTITSLKSGLFSIICEILKSSYANEIKISACQLLESFCLVDTKCSENLIQLQVCPILLPDVLEMQDHDFLEAYLSLLDPLSQLDSGLVAIKREKPMEEIMKIIESAKCEKCISKCLIALKRLSNQNRKNKTLLLELNAVAILSSCQNLLNGTEAATLCQELLDGLVVKVHHNNGGNRLSVCSQLQSTNERNFSVLWCQNKFRILITVKIPKLEWSDCKFQKTSLHFSLISNDGIKQSVNYELFDEVIVEKCAVCLQNKEAIISLCKTEVGYWPRLLQDKFNKPSNLSVDFDKIESDDSDSEEVEADEKNPFTLQVVVKEPLIKLVRKKLPSDEEEIPLPVDPTKSDEDSLENSDFEEYDRFNIFNTK